MKNQKIFPHRELTYQIIGAAMEVHRALGPGFLESVYQVALAHELTLRKVPFEREVHLPVSYKGTVVGDFIADFWVDNKVILELKAVSSLHPKHEAQAIHYLAATGCQIALLLNFGTLSLEHKRLIR